MRHVPRVIVRLGISVPPGIWLAVAVGLLVPAAPLWAQDPTRVDPHHYSVVLDHDVIRVLLSDFPPGERSEMHEHPANVTVVLSDARFHLRFADGEASTFSLQAGRVGWGAGIVHEPKNIGDQTARVMIVEFKNTQLAEGVRERESPPEPIDLGPGMTGVALIDNDLVAVRRVTVEPGASREPHANATRDLLVMPSVGTLELVIGDERIAVDPGQAHLVPSGTEHAETNSGTDSVEWIALLIEREPPER